MKRQLKNIHNPGNIRDDDESSSVRLQEVVHVELGVRGPLTTELEALSEYGRARESSSQGDLRGLCRAGSFWATEPTANETTACHIFHKVPGR